MEARTLVAAMAVMAAFACLFAAAQVAEVALRRRRAAVAAQGGSAMLGGLVAWRLRNGYAAVRPLSDALLKNRRIASLLDEAVELCAEQGLSTTCEPLASVLFSTLALLAVAASAATGSFVAGAATSACAVAAGVVVLGHRRDKRQEAIREAVPDALESMAACLGSGFTLLQTFTQVAKDTPGPLGKTFERSAHILETGGSAERALAELRDGAHASELAFVAVALDVQHQSGGAMRQVLDAANDTVKGELALRRALRVQTAQAKLSARVVVMMPFFLVAAFSLASPDFLTPFFSSAFGYALLALAITMEVAGVLLVRRALSVDGVA